MDSSGSTLSVGRESKLPIFFLNVGLVKCTLSSFPVSYLLRVVCLQVVSVASLVVPL